MVDKRPIILLGLVVLILGAPLVYYNGGSAEFSGSDDAGSDAVSETGYTPWFNSIWEPPSGEVESLLFALQAAIGAIIIGYVMGYYVGQDKERKRQEEESNLQNNEPNSLDSLKD